MPEHAKADFRLGPFHKELATWMITSAEDPEITNQQIVRVRVSMIDTRSALARSLARFVSVLEADSRLLQMTQELTTRTRGFLSKLASLQVEDEDGNQYITYENLQERKLPPNMDFFCYAVAAAEGMTKGTSR